VLELELFLFYLLSDVIDFGGNCRLYFDKSIVLFRDGNGNAGVWCTAFQSAACSQQLDVRKFYGETGG
jgi:hypothetical protein